MSRKNKRKNKKNTAPEALQRPPSIPSLGRDAGKAMAAPALVPSKVEPPETPAVAEAKAEPAANTSKVLPSLAPQGPEADAAPARKSPVLPEPAPRPKAEPRAEAKPSPPVAGAALPPPPTQRKGPPPKRRRKPRVSAASVLGGMLVNVLKLLLVILCIGLMSVSVLAVQVAQFVVAETQNDDNILDLENIKLNQTSYIMALNHENPNAKEEDDWVEYQELIGTENRIWVPLSEIPDNLKNAIIATEDRQFRDHHGVSFERTAYALLNEVLGLEDRSFGASTIDQQLVKNLTGDDDVVDESGDATAGYKRKMREIYRAWGLNNRYSKDMILEAYLNTMGLSERIAGVQAGALEYFGKNVSDLSLSECALIAGITQKPTSYSPFQNPDAALVRRDDVLTFMRNEKYIDEESYQQALKEPLGVTQRTTKEGSEDSRTIFNYFSDTVFNEVVEDLMEQKGLGYDQAVQQVYTGGYRIYATVEQNVQLALEDMYLDGYDEENGFFLDPARFPGYAARLTITETEKDEAGEVLSETTVMPQSACAVVNYDGELVAVVGGIGEKDKSLSLNRAVGTVDATGKVTGTVRQVGSTMKPLAAYALGIDKGIITYSTGVQDIGLLSRDPIAKPNAKDWPKNFNDRYRKAPLPVCSAIAESTNTVAAQVGIWVGREPMFEFLTETLQVSSLVRPNDVDIAPLVLGSMHYGMSLYELAGAYQMFGGNNTYGVYNSLHSYLRVEDSRGNIVLEPEMTTVQAIDPQSGYIMNRLLSNVLRGNVPGASPTARGMAPEGEMDSVAKTGTTSDDKDRLFVGLTPYYVTAVWWGYDQDHDFLGKWGPNAATNVPPNVWKNLMETVQADLPVKAFPDAPDAVQELYFCTSSGGRARSGCPSMLGYYADFAIPEYCPGHRKAAPKDDPPPAEAPPA